MPLPEWTGHVRHFVGAITKSDSTIYDPPIRVLEITTGGTLNFVLDGDDETDPNAVVTKTFTAGDVTYLAFRQVKTGGTAVVGNGFT